MEEQQTTADIGELVREAQELAASSEKNMNHGAQDAQKPAESSPLAEQQTDEQKNGFAEETARTQSRSSEYSEKLRKYFSGMVVKKSAANSKVFSDMGLPSYIRDWLVMRFSDKSGVFDTDKALSYVSRVIPNKDRWNILMMDMIHKEESVRFLAKIRVGFDTKNKLALFELPDFEVPKHKGEAIAEWSVVEKNKEALLVNNEVWGIVEIRLEQNESGKGNVFKLVDFAPFCPYTLKLDYYRKARSYFTTEEWIDVLIGAVDYNPEAYSGKSEKLAMLKRLLPFVEKRLNMVELAPKETGKSYIFSQISKHGWLVSGGSVTRAKMFYDINKKTDGLVSEYDYIALDEIQSINFDNPMEMQGIFKGYLESGEYRVGTHHGTGTAGLMLLGNIETSSMDVNKNMFAKLPSVFRESALIDRFHGFIKGWELPKMREELKADGWALNTEYFSEILHILRGESVYRAVVDELLILPKNAATRDTEAIKRICTAYLKLIFPNVVSAKAADPEEFYEYCLRPAMEMRGIIKTQLGIIDPGEFGNAVIPEIKVRDIKNEA